MAADQKHASLQELLNDPDFKDLGEYNDDANAEALKNEVVKESRLVNEQHKEKKHANNYVWYKFRFPEFQDSQQHLLPTTLSTFENKTKLAHWLTEALGDFYKKAPFPGISETTINALGALLYFDENKEVFNILKDPTKYKVKLRISLTSKKGKDGHTHTDIMYKVELTPTPCAIEESVN